MTRGFNYIEVCRSPKQLFFKDVDMKTALGVGNSEPGEDRTGKIEARRRGQRNQGLDADGDPQLGIDEFVTILSCGDQLQFAKEGSR